MKALNRISKQTLLAMRTTGVILALGIGTQACSTYKSSGQDSNNQNSVGPTTTFDVNKYPLNKMVCDPFENDPVSDMQAGVKASLFYKGSDQPIWYTAGEYISKGRASSQSLFFSEINVPTRLFSMGFPTQTGDIVKTDAGEKLNEYFALEFTGRLRLGPNDEPGLYELALLSDDGAVLSFQQSDGSYKVVVNNDGDHPTRFGCGERIQMDRESLIHFNLKYYQGPRYHISLIPMWRKVSESTSKDSQCGQTGNEMYFDYNNNSTPQKAYKGLLARGWKPWGFENYVLPTDDDHNPCFPGETPLINEVVLDYDLDRGLILSWGTNIPATAQVLIKNLDTGVETLTASDNVLRTRHEVVFGVGGLSAGNYEFRPVSISDTYGKTIGEAISFTAR